MVFTSGKRIMTSFRLRDSERSALARRAVSSASSRPSSRDSWIMLASCSWSTVDSSSSRCTMPNAASVLRATQFKNSMTGRVSFIHTVIGPVSHIAVDSGPAIAMFFGTISPSRMCR